MRCFFLGIPFDIALYAFMGKLIEHMTGLTFKTLVGDLSNVHFYWPHIELAKKQMTRHPKPCKPEMVFNKPVDFESLSIHDVEINDYIYHPRIKAEMYAKVK